MHFLSFLYIFFCAFGALVTDTKLSKIYMCWHWQDLDGANMLLGHFNLGYAMAQLWLAAFWEGRALRSVVSVYHGYYYDILTFILFF